MNRAMQRRAGLKAARPLPLLHRLGDSDHLDPQSQQIKLHFYHMFLDLVSMLVAVRREVVIAWKKSCGGLL